MKKIISIVIIICMLSLCLTSCVHEHDWIDATCTTPKTCNSCGETEGTSIGHAYSNATCTVPETCTLCGKINGTPTGHAYSNATCTVPETCTLCGKINGTSIGHAYSNATYTVPETCTLCGIIHGTALGHTYKQGVCTVCNELNPSAKEEQLAICEEIIEDLETLETYCYAQILAYQNAWYFAIYKAEDYYSYESILSDFSTKIAIDSTYVNDAIIYYLEDIGMETTKINALAALRTNSGALGITERAIELRFGAIGLCNELISQITTNLEKINGKVIGNDYAKAIVDYCNVILNYYSFAKTPTGSYNTYTSQASTYKTYCTNAKNKLIIAKP